MTELDIIFGRGVVAEVSPEGNSRYCYTNTRIDEIMKEIYGHIEETVPARDESDSHDWARGWNDCRDQMIKNIRGSKGGEEKVRPGEYIDEGRCPKCGTMGKHDAKYNETHNLMTRSCLNCGYNWNERPLDLK